MLAMPSSQTGWRARRKMSPTSKPAISYLLAPRRWHTEAVAVQKLAAMASRIAFSISRLLISLHEPGRAAALCPCRPARTFLSELDQLLDDVVYGGPGGSGAARPVAPREFPSPPPAPRPLATPPMPLLHTR